MSESGSAANVASIMSRMLEQLKASETLKTKCTHDNTSLGIVVTDLGVDYSLSFVKGQVGGGPGGAQDCTVCISLTSAVLDRLLSGKLDPESGYMNGTFYLKGSEYVAQGLLYYMPDIIAAYKASVAG